MKKNLMIAAALLAATSSVSVIAQQAARPAAAQAPAPTAAAPAASNAEVPSGKIAVVYASAFQDPKTGIAKFIAAANRLDTEFQPRRTELQTLQQRYNTLLQDIEKTRPVATPQTIAQKAEDAEKIKIEIERKSQDATKEYQSRFGQTMAPLYEDIGKALDAFAKQRGITMIIDASKLEGAIFITNSAVDVTSAFVADYNSKNPATASAAPPARAPGR